MKWLSIFSVIEIVAEEGEEGKSEKG